MTLIVLGVVVFVLLPLYGARTYKVGYYKGLSQGWYEVTREGQRQWPHSGLSAVFYNAGFRRGRDEGSAVAYRGGRKWW